MGKGENFERKICKKLSMWWDGDLEKGRQDLFWRSSQSGGRAKLRGRQGKQTAGHYGDVCSTDPCSVAFCKTVLLELKKGKQRGTSFADIIDRPTGLTAKAQFAFEEFLQQTIESYEQSDCLYWMLVFHRHLKVPMAFMQRSFYWCLREYKCFRRRPVPYVEMGAVIRERHKIAKNKFKSGTRKVELVGMHWQTWLDTVSPEIIKQIHKDRKRYLRSLK